MTLGKMMCAALLALLTLVGCGDLGTASQLPGIYGSETYSGRQLGTPSEIEKQVLERTNAERAKVGKPALKFNSKLNIAAQRHAIDMARKGEMEHDLDGKTPQDRIEAAGYRWSTYAENIAYGYQTAAAAVAGWISSPGHRVNMLDEENSGFDEIGIGVQEDKEGTPYYCQVFGKS